MSIPGNANPLLLASAAGAGAYQIERSTRFNSADSAYLSRTPASAGNRKTWTLSFWVKRGASTGSDTGLFSTYSGSNPATTGYFNSNDGITFYNYSGSYQFQLITSQVFRDYSAWYHVVFAVDTTQATSSNRVKIYVNGSQITTFSTETYPSQNVDTDWNSTTEHQIGNHASYFNGYLADVHFIDGQALTPSSFTEVSATTGQLIPKAYTGTFTGNSFWLKFADNSAATATTLGKDSSGLGNNWTPNNFSITDGSVATAGGAKPILNTTDAYGGTLGTGVASDPNASSLYLCAALATSAGVNLTDQQPTGRTTPSLTINNSGGFTSTTTTSQYYGGSLNLTGGNYLTVTSGLGVFNGNFTIEAWFRRTGTTALMTLFDTWCAQASGTGFYMWWDGGGLDLVKDSGTYYVNRTGTDLPIDTWCHVALVRSSNTFTCYINGSSLFTYTVVDNWTSNRINIGGASTNGVPWVGQIQDVRIYNTAKYTANFSVPSRTAGSGNDSLVDTPTSYGTDTGAGGEVRGNYATLNPLDGSPTGLSNGNLDAASANAYPTIFPGSGQWYYEVNGTGYTWDGTRSNWTPRSGSHNFGQRAFSGTPSSGYKALCDTNLPAPVVAQPSTVMDVKLYTGNGSTQTISGLGFSPDLVWIKSRVGTVNHVLTDSVRGAALKLASNITGAEAGTDNGYLSAFTSDGFTVAQGGGLSPGIETNYNPGTPYAYAAWCWDAGSSTVTNTDGTITSQVRANASAGFSIVGYDGPGGFQSVGHGLNTVPEMMIFKKRTGSSSWAVYHKYANANPQSGYLILNSTADFTSSTSVFGNTLPTSSVFYLNGNSLTAKDGTVISYCFAPVAGYSSFGSYTGNGSADGPFVYLGFRPAVVIVKMSSSTGNWTILDDKREGYNVDNDPLFPNLTNAEGTTDLIDITSNGFKVRTTDATFNTNAGTYVYAAWAEFPFQYARAR